MARAYFKQSLEIMEELNDIKNISTLRLNIAKIEMDYRHYEDALTIVREVFSDMKDTQYKDVVLESTLMKIEILVSTNSVDQAALVLNQIFPSCYKKDNPDFLGDCYRIAALILKKKPDIDLSNLKENFEGEFKFNVCLENAIKFMRKP